MSHRQQNTRNGAERGTARTYSTFTVDDPYEYMRGLTNYHEAECIPGSLPLGQMHPQKTKGGLYPDRLSGAPFTTPRKESKQTTYYRTIPSTSVTEYEWLKSHPANCDYDPSHLDLSPNPEMWLPTHIDPESDFLTGLKLLASAGDPASRKGLAYYVYTAGKSMPEDHVFTSTDGDMLIVAQQGAIDIRTEMGPMRVRPNEIAVVPRAIRFHVSVVDGPARGYVLEVFINHFELPDLGPLGSVGLANDRDFQIPQLPPYKPGPDTQIFNKFNGRIYGAKFKGTVFNVIAWQGTFFPFKYDMGRFNTMGSLTYDHTDPSILVALTVAGETPDTPLVELAAIGPKWTVHEHTLRPAYSHRNFASEFYAFLKGGHNGEEPGVISLYNCMAAHGVTRQAWDKAIHEELVPIKPDPNSMSVMFESCYSLALSKWASETKISIGNRFDEFEPAKV